MYETEKHRVEPDDVRRLLTREDFDTTGLEDEQYVGFIDDANALIEERDAIRSANSDRMLTKIEAALAGAFIQASGIDGLRETERERNDRTEQHFAGDYDFVGIMSTSLGQLAASWDDSGTLRELGKPSASIGVPDVKGGARRGGW